MSQIAGWTRRCRIWWNGGLSLTKHLKEHAWADGENWIEIEVASRTFSLARLRAMALTAVEDIPNNQIGTTYGWYPSRKILRLVKSPVTRQVLASPRREDANPPKNPKSPLAIVVERVISITKVLQKDARIRQLTEVTHGPLQLFDGPRVKRMGAALKRTPRGCFQSARRTPITPQSHLNQRSRP